MSELKIQTQSAPNAFFVVFPDGWLRKKVSFSINTKNQVIIAQSVGMSEKQKQMVYEAVGKMNEDAERNSFWSRLKKLSKTYAKECFDMGVVDTLYDENGVLLQSRYWLAQ